MSELIRKITGISGPDEVNYIPIIHYCVCDTAAEEKTKIAKWIGNSDGTEASPNDFKLYKGINIAVLFVNGFGVETDAPEDGFLLQVNGNEPLRMIRESDDTVLNKLNPNTVVLFIYDGQDFRMVNGISGAQFDDLKESLNGQISDLRNSMVQKSGENHDEAVTGDFDQPIYVSDSSVVAIDATFGSSTNPIWLNEGHFTPSDAIVGEETTNTIKPIWMNGGTLTAFTSTVGSYSNPVFVNQGTVTPITITAGGETLNASMKPIYAQDGEIREASVTFGDDITPLKMVNGSLVPVAADLATKEQLDTEAVHSLTIDSDTFVVSAKDANGTILSEIDLPLETMVVGATYTNGNVILELKNGATTSFPVVDIINGLVKDSEGNGEGSNEQPVYVDETGTVKKTTYDLSTFVSADAEKYHNSGTYNMAATSLTSGLITTITGNNIEGITLTMPIYWGNSTPIIPAATGALYIELETESQ